MASFKHPSVAFWATVVVVLVLVGYPLSFGPACWISSRSRPNEALSDFYLRVGVIFLHAPRPVVRLLGGYARIGMIADSAAVVPYPGDKAIVITSFEWD